MNQPAVRGFDWAHGNRRKCLKHGMSIADIEAVFARPVVILPDKAEVPLVNVD